MERGGYLHSLRVDGWVDEASGFRRFRERLVKWMMDVVLRAAVDFGEVLGMNAAMYAYDVTKNIVILWKV